MICNNCKMVYEGNYCPACGEKKFNRTQLSFKHFSEELLEGIIHFDNKFFKTLKILISKPGQLTVDYSKGKWVVYMKPVQFFLVINLLFFFLTAGSNLYSLSLNNYILYKPFTNYNTVQLVNMKLKHNGLSFKEYQLLFDEKMNSDSKEFIFLFIPFYGLLFYLTLFWKRKFISEHFAFAAHFVAFVLLWDLCANFCINIPYYLITHENYSQLFDTISSWITVGVITIYFGLAIRRFYKPPFWFVILLSLALGYTFFEFIQYYRMILFFKILNLG